MLKNTLSRRVLAVAATAALGFGLAACAETEKAAETGGDVVSSAAEKAEEAVKGDKDKDAVEPSTPDSEPAEGEVQVETEDGTVALPAAAAAALESFTAEWGQPESIEANALGQVLAKFQEGNIVTWAQELGAIPVVGKIAETWLDEGGLENPLGLPTGPEQAAPEGNGWVQQFAHGVISWVTDADGEFTAVVEQN
ncbi:LGFP repeat-containing protein [Corynebacterium nasicanis]|uniref:LGFP repeat-containing protein n=1 Tax=Corynebacterium nasicanis TaxID=1448267 RepID=A0ABW1QCN5_9CORY